MVEHDDSVDLVVVQRSGSSSEERNTNVKIAEVSVVGARLPVQGRIVTRRLTVNCRRCKASPAGRHRLVVVTGRLESWSRPQW